MWQWTDAMSVLGKADQKLINSEIGYGTVAKGIGIV
jgi:hypothetical protein